ncbi:MAG: hypothetical protein JWP75_2509 [Frondihabitans sp.]|nr:hypothetical protein [Frondihabitans sp.]
MKKTLRAVPYALLLSAVAATIAVPLTAADAQPEPAGAGGSRSAATAVAPAPAPAENIRFSGRFVLWTGSTKTWVGVPVPAGLGEPASATGWPTKEQAAARAGTWSFPAPDATGPVRRGDICLTLGLSGTRVTTLTCDGSASQQLSFVEATNGTTLRSQASTSSYIDFDPASGTLTSRDRRYADGLQFDLLAPVNLRDVRVDEVTQGAVGTATLAGTATVGASVSTPLAGEKVEVGGDGRWILTVTGVPAGGADLVVTQSIAGTSYGSANAHVDAWDRPDAPTATWRFPEDVHQRGLASGTGIEGATISIRQGEDEVATAEVQDGAWETEVDALGSGVHELAITQTVGGLESQPTPLSVDYGAAVSITSPEDGSDVEGDTVDLAGRGAPGSLIEVRMPGSDEVLGTTRVNEDGDWTLTDVPLADLPPTA